MELRGERACCNHLIFSTAWSSLLPWKRKGRTGFGVEQTRGPLPLPCENLVLDISRKPDPDGVEMLSPVFHSAGMAAP